MLFYALYTRRWCTKRIIEGNITIFFNVINRVHTYSVMWFCLEYLSLLGCYAVSTSTKMSTFRQIVVPSHSYTSSAIIQYHLRTYCLPFAWHALPILNCCIIHVLGIPVQSNTAVGHPSTVKYCCWASQYSQILLLGIPVQSNTAAGHPSTVKYCCCRSCKLQNHILPYISIRLLFKAKEWCTIHRNK
jgi:hypothetical protein